MHPDHQASQHPHPDLSLSALPWICLGGGLCIFFAASDWLIGLLGVVLVVAGLVIWMVRLAHSAVSAPPESYTPTLYELQGSDVTRPARLADDPGLLANGQLVWKQSFETGNPAIDNQHRQLFQLCNELIDMIAAGLPLIDLETLFADLVAQVERHFEYEEAAMADAHDPNCHQHEVQHHALLLQASTLLANLHDGSEDRNGLSRFVSHDLIVKHVLELDMSLSFRQARLTAGSQF